jgi:hypothetical protein
MDDDSTLTTTNNNSNIHCNKKICIINTDNVPGNGTVLKQHVLILAKEKQKQQQEQQDQAVDNKLTLFISERLGRFFLDTLLITTIILISLQYNRVMKAIQRQ